MDVILAFVCSIGGWLEGDEEIVWVKDKCCTANLAMTKGRLWSRLITNVATTNIMTYHNSSVDTNGVNGFGGEECFWNNASILLR
jgi:hypothetical protein